MPIMRPPAAEFGDKALADLTYAIGLMNAFNRFGSRFRSTPAAAAKALRPDIRRSRQVSLRERSSVDIRIY